MLEPLPTFAGAAFQGKVLLEEAGKRLGAASAGNGFDESGYYVLLCTELFDFRLRLLCFGPYHSGPDPLRTDWVCTYSKNVDQSTLW